MPTESKMFGNLLRQVDLADQLGFDTAWIGGAHLSLNEHQRTNTKPVLPHFRGEVCLNTDIFQLAHVLLARTNRIAIGSAIQSILAVGGPIGHAEALLTFLTLQSQTPYHQRRLKFGFGSGRFDFVLSAFGIAPRDPAEKAAWPSIRNLIFRQAVEIFCRLAIGQSVASNDIEPLFISRAVVKSDEEWRKFQTLKGLSTDVLELPAYWTFDKIRLVPQEINLAQADFYLGTTDLLTVAVANRYLPCRVLNLSNTATEVIETTQIAMSKIYHQSGGGWQRDFMPRTVLVFLDANKARTPLQQSAYAQKRARSAMIAWQNAMEGTISEHKLSSEMQNAIVGNPDEVASQIKTNYHPKDRLMLWFDFNNHDSNMVENSMIEFSQYVIPRLQDID